MASAMPAWLVAFFQAPPPGVRVLGYLLLVLTAMQLGVGYRRFRLRRVSFRRLHFDTGWAIGGVMGVHAVIGGGHALSAFTGKVLSTGGHVHVYLPASAENLPIWLAVEGLAILALFAVQALSGLGKLGLRRAQFLALHSTEAWAIAGFASLHAALATWHLLAG